MRKWGNQLVGLLTIQALLGLAGLIATVGQHDALGDAIYARGPLSESGLSPKEFSQLVDLVYYQALAVFGFLALAWAVVAVGAATRRTWTRVWANVLAAAVGLYAVMAVTGDLVPPRARPVLLASAAVGLAVVAVVQLGARNSSRSGGTVSVASTG